MHAGTKGTASMEEKVMELGRDDLRKVALATGERVRRGVNWLPMADLRKIVVTYCTPQAW